MAELIIPFHSVVDIITNSSTIIYTGVTDNAAYAVRGIINEVLRAAGSTKGADDLYDIELIDDIDYGNLAATGHQVNAESVGWAVDSSVYQRSAIVVRLRGDNGNTTISDLLAKIFVVDADYG